MFRIIMTSPNIMNKIIKGPKFMVFHFFITFIFYLGEGREDPHARAHMWRSEAKLQVPRIKLRL